MRNMPSTMPVITAMLRHKKPFTLPMLCEELPKSATGTVSHALHVLTKQGLLHSERDKTDPNNKRWQYEMSPRWAKAKFKTGMALRMLSKAHSASHRLRKTRVKRAAKRSNGALPKRTGVDGPVGMAWVKDQHKAPPLTAPGNFLSHWEKVNRDSVLLDQLRPHLQRIRDAITRIDLIQAGIADAKRK